MDTHMPAWGHWPSSTRAFLASLSTEQTGTIMMSKYILRYGHWREAEWIVSYGERQVWRCEGSVKHADVCGLLASWSHGHIEAWSAAHGHIWVSGPTVARVYVDDHGSFAPKFCVDTQCLDQHLKPCLCLRVMWPREPYRSEHTVLPTQGNSDFWAWALA